MSDDAPRKPLWFTFGNHMHWVGTQWLRSDPVLPDSVDEMIALCRAAGAKGNANFDGIGYERLAVENPAALARLRGAIAAGTVEVVGATYGQPHGLFCSGESNVRQHVRGARTVRRLLGVWPRSFWEKAFHCFPQLPQMLHGAGFDAASLVFECERHAPSSTIESTPLVRWEGVDGTRIAALARTSLCVNGWPEDLDRRLDLVDGTGPAVLVQWLELSSRPDPGCGSAALLPRLHEFLADRRFAVRPATLAELVRALDDGSAPLRRCAMGDVFHGLTLGKNGDRYSRAIDRADSMLLAAESLAATASLLDRPDPSRDAYPTWELDEAWRELLAAQHHDHQQCERQCGSIGMLALRRAEDLGSEVESRHLEHLATEVRVRGDRMVVRNQLGWTRDIVVPPPPEWDAVDEPCRVARAIPAFGWLTICRDDLRARIAEPISLVASHEALLRITRGPAQVSIDTLRGVITELRSGPDRIVLDIGRLAMVVDGVQFEFGTPTAEVDGGHVALRFRGPRHDLTLGIDLADDGATLELDVEALPRPDPGYGGALRLAFDGLGADWTLRHDTPYAIDVVEPRGRHQRRYPIAERTTSPQWFETVDRPFTARSLVDLGRPAATRLLCVHDGSQGWQRTDAGIEAVLFAFDPWDEARAMGPAGFHARFALLPHSRTSGAWAIRRAAELRDEPRRRGGAGPGGAAPATFGALVCEPSNVVVTAFHREHRTALEYVERAFDPAVREPVVVRLVEFDGIATECALRLPGRCAGAARTDLLGAVVEPLTSRPCDGPSWSPAGLPWSELRFGMRAREITTIMLDL